MAAPRQQGSAQSQLNDASAHHHGHPQLELGDFVPPTHIKPHLEKQLSNAYQWDKNSAEARKIMKRNLEPKDKGCTTISSKTEPLHIECLPYSKTIDLIIQENIDKHGISISFRAKQPTSDELTKKYGQDHDQIQGVINYVINKKDGVADLAEIKSGNFLHGGVVVYLTGKQIMVDVFQQLVLDTFPNSVKGEDASYVTCRQRNDPERKIEFPWRLIMAITKPIDKIDDYWDKIKNQDDPKQEKYVTWYQQFGFHIDKKKYKDLVEAQYELNKFKHEGQNFLPWLKSKYKMEKLKNGRVVAECVWLNNLIEDEIDEHEDEGTYGTVYKWMKMLYGYGDIDIDMVFKRESGSKSMISPYNAISYNHHYYGQSNHNQRGHVHEYHDGSNSMVSKYNAKSYNYDQYGQSNHNAQGHVHLHDGYYPYYDDYNYIQPSNHVSFYNEMALLLTVIITIGFICICVSIICVILGSLVWKLRNYKKRQSSLDQDDDDMISNSV